MSENETVQQTAAAPEENIMGVLPIPRLLAKFAIPTMVSMFVNSVYNLVDQIFIGHGVGFLGNAATTAVYPFTLFTLAIGLMIAVGTAANVGLNLGRKNQEMANKVLANGLTLALLFGCGFCALGEIFLPQLLRLFGATDNAMPYAMSYGRIAVFGIIFMTVGIFLNDQIRADGDPGKAMRSMLTGAVINCVLDPLFIFVFHWGVAGAAWATVLGQLVSMLMLLRHKFRTLELKGSNMKPEARIAGRILLLGLPSFFAQAAILAMNIVLNHQAVTYGGLSKFGKDIPLAVFGIVMKVNQMMFAFINGTTAGTLPLFSYNYGAQKYRRVRKLIFSVGLTTVCIGLVGMFIFQTFPQPIINLFGQEDALYNEFAVMCLKNMTLTIFVVGIQLTANVYFQAIGKPLSALIISLSRQLLIMIPILLILPRFIGVLGCMWAFPISDILAVILSVILLIFGIRDLNRKMREAEAGGIF